MQFTKDIYFDKRIIEDTEVSILYKGKFYKDSSSKVFIVFKYGINCEIFEEKEMILTSTGFVVDINITGKYSFDFYFKNEKGNIDDNNGEEYTTTIYSKIYTEDSGKELIKSIDVEDELGKEKVKKISEEDDEDNKKEEIFESMNRYKDKKKNRYKRLEELDSLYSYVNSKDAREYDLGKIRLKEFEDEYKYREKVKKKRRYEKGQKRRKKIRLICAIILMCCITYGIIYLLECKNVQKESQDLLSTIVIDNTIIDEITMETEITERMLKIKELSVQYPELKAWIEIEGTNINYPVMQGTDNSFYMNHDYKKEYSRWGTLFLDKAYDWSLPSSNLLIYGHNFSDGVMLSNLLKYKDKSFFESHPIIKFTTPEEDAEYEIIAVFYSRVYYKSETNVFRYYYFVNAESEAEYNEFVTNAKKASIYDTGKTAEYGDQLLTLSTCEYSQEDGRFAVVARKKE